MKPLVAVVLVLLVSGCVRRPVPAPREEPAVTDSAGRALSDDELVVRLAAARYVLMGERHDDACIHRLQERLVRLAADAGLAFAVGLEMVDVDYVSPLDDFNEGRLDSTALRRALDWEERWGFDWSLYAPVLDTARRAGIRVEPLNAPKRLLHSMGVEGATLDVAEGVSAEWLTPVVLEPPPAQRQYLQEIFEAHAGHLPASQDREAAFARFVRVQSAWDTQLAWAARHVARRSQRVFVLAGAGHVEHGWGIEHRLASLDAGASVLSIMPLAGELSPELADLYFACPLPEASTPLESSAR